MEIQITLQSSYSDSDTFSFPIILPENSEQMSAIVISDGTDTPYHGFRHLALWEILITMNGMMKTQGQKQIGSLRGPNPGARSGAIRAPRAPSCSTGGAIAFQCFKLDLFIYFFQFSSSDIKLFYYTYTFYGLSFHKTEMELLILLQ